MDVSANEVGVGLGGFIATLVAYMKLKPKKDDQMAVLKGKIYRMEGRMLRFEDALRTVANRNTENIKSLSDDIVEIKEDVKSISKTMLQVFESVYRLEGASDPSRRSGK